MTEEEINFDIVMKDKTYDRLFCLMENIKDLNKGNEIGAWLTGEWSKEDDGTLKLLVDRFIIPKQEVTSAGVDIEPEGCMDAFNQLTPKDKPIIGHWHLHPFGIGTTNWSGPDETKIKDWMNPTKDREIFVFMLSSLDTLKARVEIRTTTKYPVGGLEVDELCEYDDLPVRREKIIENKGHLKELAKSIKEKVTEKVYPAYTPVVRDRGYDNYGGYVKQASYTNPKEAYDNIWGKKDDTATLFLVTRNASYVRAKVQEEMLQYIDMTIPSGLPELRSPTNVKEKSTLTEYGFECKDSAEAIVLQNKLLTVLGDIQKEYQDVENIIYEDAPIFTKHGY